MNTALTNPVFWRLYFGCEGQDISGRDIDLQLNELARDFVVRTDMTSQRRTVEFPLACGDGIDLLIDYQPDPLGGTTSLFLFEASSNEKQEMGWWDSARWHPYCLHPDELDILLRYWTRGASPWPEEQTGLLLLAPFVGLSNEQARLSLLARVEWAYRTLCPQALDHLSLEIPDADYCWAHDEALGWVFSGVYPCYSIRNQSHVAGDEGLFPFSQFREMIDRVRRS
jgi:hypothetical protein